METSIDKRWVEISVVCAPEAVDDIANLLGRYCSGGAVVEEKPPVEGAESAPTAVTVKGFLPAWDQETWHKLEVALLLLARVSGVSEPHTRVLESEDWAESWKAFFPPQHIGAHTVIVPTWHEYSAQPDEVILRLDPGMAFGTGLHATTRLCLIALERCLRPGMQVLDIGTGSGILSIAAALQGADRVLALDNDPVAVEVARQNVALNDVQERVSVALGTLGGEATPTVPAHQGGEYDLVLANILAEIISRMAPAFPAVLKAGGTLIASGIIAEKADAVVEALQAAGLHVEQRLQQEDWVALLASRS